MTYIGWMVAYGSYTAMGGPSVVPRVLLGPWLPEGPFFPALRGYAAFSREAWSGYLCALWGLTPAPPVLYSLIEGPALGR